MSSTQLPIICWRQDRTHHKYCFKCLLTELENVTSRTDGVLSNRHSGRHQKMSLVALRGLSLKDGAHPLLNVNWYKILSITCTNPLWGFTIHDFVTWSDFKWYFYVSLVQQCTVLTLTPKCKGCFPMWHIYGDKYSETKRKIFLCDLTEVHECILWNVWHLHPPSAALSRAGVVGAAIWAEKPLSVRLPSHWTLPLAVGFQDLHRPAERQSPSRVSWVFPWPPSRWDMPRTSPQEGAWPQFGCLYLETHHNIQSTTW